MRISRDAFQLYQLQRSKPINKHTVSADVMSCKEKGDLLLDAYFSRRKIKPFELEDCEEIKIWHYVREKLVEREGLGGYKIAVYAFGWLTKGMIQVGGEELELRYPVQKAEVEIIAEITSVEDPISNYIPHIGIELPGTRFDPPAKNHALAQADNASASLLYVGPSLEPGKWNFEAYHNGEKVLETPLSYSVEERIRTVVSKAGSASGYCALGNLQKAFMVKRGDSLRITGSAEFGLKFL